MAASHKGFACDERLVEAAENIIAQSSCMVSKPVRAGMSTSTILACKRQGLRLLALAPTRRILKETFDRGGDSTRIPANSECLLMEPDLKKNPILYQLPLALPDCTKCKLVGVCEVLQILREDDPQLMTLTYHKIEALMLSRGGTAHEILDKMSRADVIMIDECHELALPTVASVKAFATVKIPEKYSVLERIQQAWLLFCENHVKTIAELMTMAESGHASKHLSRGAINMNPLPWAELTKAWPELRKLAVQNVLEDDEILQLRDIITIMAAGHVALSYTAEGEGVTGAIYLSTGQVRMFRALNEFLVTRVYHSKVLFVSGTNFEPHPGFFSALAGKEVKPVIFPDIRKATEKMTLIPDTWKLTSRNFREKLPDIIECIKAIAEKEKQPIYLLAPNGRKAAWIRKELKIIGLTSVFVDFYRSDRTLGVEHNERICIAIGFAETPANACDALAIGNDPDERWLDSKRLRVLDVDAATWQGVNRVRDPAGRMESKVYFVGGRLDQVRRVAKWGTNRILLCKKVKESRGSKGETFRTAEFYVHVDEEIELPKIYGEYKGDTHSNRRKLNEYIQKLEFYKNSFKNSQNHAISSTNI